MEAEVAVEKCSPAAPVKQPGLFFPQSLVIPRSFMHGWAPLQRIRDRGPIFLPESGSGAPLWHRRRPRLEGSD